ncbi:WhiB family transcriptional regulator [Streptomyces longwoodensis]|uniref:WhiB family transcriptional regulator n=1 Tax=Streptomyces longwoodensis TaxID=68231 RepID=UPI0033C27E6D
MADAVELLTPSAAGARSWDVYWRQRGACTRPDSDKYFFATRSHACQQEALQICGRCAVSTECLAYALDERIPEERGLVFPGQSSDGFFHAAIRNLVCSAWTSRGGRYPTAEWRRL